MTPLPRLQERAERIRAAVAERDAETAIILRREHIFWLTGHEPPDDDAAAAVVTPRHVLLLWPDEPPDELAAETIVETYDGHAASLGDARRGQHAVGRSFMERALRRPGLLDKDSIPPWLHEIGAPIRAESAFLAQVIRRKGREELAVVERNLAANDKAFERVARSFAAGATDLDIFAWTVETLARETRGPVAWEGNIGLGEAGDYFDALPTGVVAATGDVLFVDLYPRIDHYVGDSTRCFVAGDAPDWANRIHEALEAAIIAVEQRLRPGAIAGELDAACRAILDARGFGEYFPHHTGHGVGLFAHEPPYLVPESRDVVQEGDVVTVEPGVYLPGRGGLRLEEVYAIENDAARPLTTYPKALTECG